MPRSLVIPGVSIATEFDVAPPLPARSGILGAVGVVDRGPSETRSATTRQELLDIFGPATAFSFPEVFSAIANGVSQVVVSPVRSTSGQVAKLTLLGDGGDPVAELRARAIGPWGGGLAVQVTRRVAPDGTVRSVKLQVQYNGEVIETHDGLILREGDDQDFFVAINRDSRVIVAVDPVFETDLPVLDPGLVAFADNPAAAASGTLQLGSTTLIRAVATQAGVASNNLSFEVAEGHALATFNDGASTPAVRVVARKAGATGTTIQVEILANVPAGGVDVNITGLGATVRSYPGLTGIQQLVQALEADPDIRAERPNGGSNLLPAPATRAPLTETRTVTVRVEGVRTTSYADLASASDIVAALNGDGAVKATLVGVGTALPDPATANPANSFYLTGGRDAGLSRSYVGKNNPDHAIVDFIPAPNSSGSDARFRVSAGTAPNTVRVTAGVDRGAGFQLQETFDDVVLDPDSDRFLPAVLQGESKLLRAVGHIERTRATHLARETPGPTPLVGGTMPTLDAFQSAIDALADEESVDLLLAGLQGWADPSLDGLAVQRALLAHARTQADAAHPRIVLGSIRPSENNDVRAIVDHASQVADRRFVLVAPFGAEGAVAGLLGHLDYFQSPTFKTVADAGVPLVPYADADLDKLIGPDANVCVVRSRRGRGTIVLKGIASDGFQISVLRVADHCVREVKAIADRFIGELNNADSRNALRQMIIATFAQLERDGAIVPSVDGKSPASVVDVYASQNDAAAGIVRIDIAVRPVRAIDYVYATIRVKN